MLRRKSTRIELKIDDMAEWTAVKKEKEREKKSQVGDRSNQQPESLNLQKSRRDVIHERIGYEPRSSEQMPRDMRM